MKRILFVASVYAHLSAFHKPFMKLLQNKGYEVHAIGSNSLGRKNELLNMGIICHDIEFDRLPFSKKNILALKELNELFKNISFELIHVHTPTAAFFTRFAASKNKQGRVLYTAHGFHFYKGATKKNWLLFYSAEKLAVKWTDGLIVMNEEDYSLGKRLGFNENENLFYVHGVGVDIEEFKGNNLERNIKEELKIRKDDLVISCIAELSKRKNQKFLLENWNSINQKYPNAHLLLVGDGKDKKNICDFISLHNLKNIHILGFRKDVPQIIASSDIVTLVSKHEGLPRCLMEGMAVGKPIISTNVRGSRDLVDQDSTGFLIELGDNANLTSKFIDLLTKEELRKKFGENAKIKIQDYDLQNVLNEMDSIYSKYLNNKNL